MFENYASAVLRDYKRKGAEGLLLTNLVHPTPAKLKRECLIVFDNRYLRKDEGILSSFFEPRQDQEAYRLAIKKHERDKFKSINAILKNGERKTDEKNIELIAWLIDYPHRPYRKWVDDGEPSGLEPPQQQKDNLKIFAAPPSWLTKKIKVTLTFAASMVFGMLIYLSWPKSPTVGSLQGFAATQRGDCMYWAGEHFIKGSCALTHRDTPALPVDTFRLAHFKRVTDLSTIGENSVRKVWYAKIRGQLELFTQPGFHPVDTARRLLPLTAYMLHKYIKPGTQ